MTSAFRRRLACAGVALGLVIGVGAMAVPAGAHEDVGAHGTITAPSGDVATTPIMTGRFETAPIETVTEVVLTVSPTGPTRGGRVSTNGCALAKAGKCGESKMEYSWLLPAMAYNGPYTLDATAKHCLSVCVGPPVPTRARPVTFRLAMPPKPPVELIAEPADNGAVQLSWARNSEPDMIGYAVFRRRFGVAGFEQVGGPIPQPLVAGSRVSFLDVTTTGGGAFTYYVIAVRHGASGDAATAVSSGQSSPTTAALPVTAAPAPAAGSPTTTVKGGGTNAGAASNLGAFLNKGAPATTVPEVDTGFDRELPFDAEDAEPGEEPEPGEPEAVPPRSRPVSESRSGGPSPLVPVAVGSILMVLAVHLRLFSRKLAAPPPMPLAVTAAGDGGPAYAVADQGYVSSYDDYGHDGDLHDGDYYDGDGHDGDYQGYGAGLLVPAAAVSVPAAVAREEVVPPPLPEAPSPAGEPQPRRRRKAPTIDSEEPSVWEVVSRSPSR